MACLSQTLFALNRRYLINEKGALEEAGLPITIAGLKARVAGVWRAIGAGAFRSSMDRLRKLDRELARILGAS